MRVCSQPGCPALIPKAGRCATHAREVAKARGTTTERGYGHSHVKTRREWEPLVAIGSVRCSRCRRYIKPDEAWHLDHDDNDRTKYRGPSCAKCNLSAAGRASHGLPAFDPPPF